MRYSQRNFRSYTLQAGLVALILGAGIVAAPSASRKNTTFAQDAAPSNPPTTPTPSQPKKIELPEGDGKAIATEFCQDCHRLTNLTKAHKTQDEWRDTVSTMVGRGARITDDKVDMLVVYLAKNFGPAGAAPAAAAITPATTSSVTPPTPPASATAAVSTSTTATGSTPASTEGAASTKPKKIELPDGDGKALAVEYCQDCHKLSNVTTAHKSEDEWHDTIEIMMIRGARIPEDQVSALVHYLAKNFPAQGGSSAPVPAAAISSTPHAL